MYKISIIIPVYNGEKYIRKCLNSIINQNYENKEIIIVNDCSNDNTKNICENYTQKYGYIKLINLPNNQGVSSARNIGIDKASGKYISFIDADDEIIGELYKDISILLEHEEYDLIIFGSNHISKNKIKEEVTLQEKKYINKNEIVDYLYNIDIKQKPRVLNVIWNKIYSKEVIQENNLRFREDIDLGEDFIFNCNYFKHINRIFDIKKCYYNYYVKKSNNLTTKFRTDIIYRRDLVYNEWISLYKYYNIYDSKKKLEFQNYEGFLMYHSICSIFKKDVNISDKEKICFLETILESKNIDTVLEYLKGKISKLIELNLIKKKKAKILYYFMKIKIDIKKLIKTIIKYD